MSWIYRRRRFRKRKKVRHSRLNWRFPEDHPWFCGLGWLFFSSSFFCFLFFPFRFRFFFWNATAYFAEFAIRGCGPELIELIKWISQSDAEVRGCSQSETQVLWQAGVWGGGVGWGGGGQNSGRSAQKDWRADFLHTTVSFISFTTFAISCWLTGFFNKTHTFLPKEKSSGRKRRTKTPKERLQQKTQDLIMSNVCRKRRMDSWFMVACTVLGTPAVAPQRSPLLHFRFQTMWIEWPEDHHYVVYCPANSWASFPIRDCLLFASFDSWHREAFGLVVERCAITFFSSSFILHSCSPKRQMRVLHIKVISCLVDGFWPEFMEGIHLRFSSRKACLPVSLQKIERTCKFMSRPRKTRPKNRFTCWEPLFGWSAFQESAWKFDKHRNEGSFICD